MSRESRLIKQISPKLTPIGSNMVLPNNSGDHVRSIKRQDPVEDVDLVNKGYVDTAIAASGNWTRAGTTLSPTNTGDDVDTDGSVAHDIGAANSFSVANGATGKLLISNALGIINTAAATFQNTLTATTAAVDLGNTNIDNLTIDVMYAARHDRFKITNTLAMPNTKTMVFDTGAIPAGETKTYTAPDIPAASDYFVTRTDTSALTNKTLTSPTITTPSISSPALTGNLTTNGLIDGIDIATDVAANTAKVSSPITNYDYLKYSYNVASGTGGGTATLGAWRIRAINTEDHDTGAIGSLSANVITLPAGTYEVWATQNFWRTGQSRIRLYDNTNSATLLASTAAYSVAGGNEASVATIAGLIVLAGTVAMQLEYRTISTYATSGLGLAASMGDAEVHCIITFKRIAT